MVDALRRACRWAAPPDGRLIDLRPADVHPDVELGLPDGSVLHVGGLVVDEERYERHSGADAAVRTALDRGLVRTQHEDVFAFYRYPDSADELRDYIATKWQHTRMDEATYTRASAMLREHAGSRLWLREQVRIRVLV
jgi:hypothetical protein